MTDIPYREKVLRILRAGGPPEALVDAIVAIRVSAFARRMTRPPAALTKDIAGLFPEQFVETVEQCRQTIHGRMKTAREILKNPDARWRVDKVSDGVIRITRMEDGAKYERGVLSLAVLEIAALHVGDSKIAEHIKSVRGKGQMGTNTKIAARRFLGNDAADWSVRSTSQGVRVTRIA